MLVVWVEVENAILLVLRVVVELKLLVETIPAVVVVVVLAKVTFEEPVLIKF